MGLRERGMKMVLVVAQWIRIIIQQFLRRWDHMQKRSPVTLAGWPPSSPNQEQM